MFTTTTKNNIKLLLVIVELTNIDDDKIFV